MYIMKSSLKRNGLVVLSLLAGGFTACVSPMVEVGETREAEAVRRNEIVARGMSLVDMRDLGEVNGFYRNDCSGFVVGVYRSLGYEAELSYYNSRYVAENLYKNLRSRGLVYYGMRPKKADVAFFRNTIENSGNRVTHVGLVTEVEQDDTVVIVHYSSRGVSTMRMNLQQPHVHRDEAGQVLNDFLRKKPPGTREARLLSGELFYMFGDFYNYVVD
jgi:hypothetical protein